MRYRKLGSTGVEVSELGFGMWTVATKWWGEHSDESALQLMNAAVDEGVTFFDTSDTYGQGRGETLLADLTKERPRESLVIATKFGYDWQSNPNVDGQRESPQDFSLEFVQKALEGSLRRLNSEYIDLWQLHNPRQDALDNDDLFTFLQKAKANGKIRAIGVALGPAIGWRDEGIYAFKERGVDVVQMIYNVLEQDPGRELIKAARAADAGLLVRVPHSSGMLEGKYTADTTFPETDHRSHRKREWLEHGLKALQALTFLTEGSDALSDSPLPSQAGLRRGRRGPAEGGGEVDVGEAMTIGQAALRFVVAQPEVAAALPNIYDADQLNEFASASDHPDLTSEQLQRLDSLFESEFKETFAPAGRH